MTASVRTPLRSPPARPLEVLALLWRVILTGGEARLRNGQRLLIVAGGKAFDQTLDRFEATSAGARLTQTQPDTLALFKDRTRFLVGPSDSLGRHYISFLGSAGLDESYYTRTPLPEMPEGDRAGVRRWFRARTEYGHDMRHVLAGYPPDELGEICLLAFRYGQNANPGALLLTLLGLIAHLGRWRAIHEAYRRGRSATPLDILAWEDQLAEPLAAARAALKVPPTKHYPAPYAPEAYLPSPSGYVA